MGRIMTRVRVMNVMEPSKQMEIDALVDTGAYGLVLPATWRSLLGDPAVVSTVELVTADQSIICGEVCGPVEIQIEGFRRVIGEVIFIPMEPHDGKLEPLLGYTILEQSLVAVDMAHHRLVGLRYADLRYAVVAPAARPGFAR